MAQPRYTVQPLDGSTWKAFGAPGEGCPEAGASVPAGFLFNGVLSTYEQLGLTHNRKIGKHRWMMTKVVEPR